MIVNYNMSDMNNEVEIWKDVPGYEGYYQCSNFGEVKGVERYVNNRYGSRIQPEVILSKDYSRGYVQFTLSKNGSYKRYKGHQLVLMSFIGYVPDKGVDIVVDHIDNNKTNNMLSNLQLVSTRSNTIKSIDKSKTSSLYTGVSRHKNGKWISQLSINGTHVYLGIYENEIDAYKTYQKKLSEI